MCLTFNVTMSVGDVGSVTNFSLVNPEGNRSRTETQVWVIYIELIRKEIRFEDEDLIHLTVVRVKSGSPNYGFIKDRMTRHGPWDSSGRVMSSLQRPVRDNAQHSHRDRHPCLRWDSNPQPQQVNSSVPSHNRHSQILLLIIKTSWSYNHLFIHRCMKAERF